MIFNVAIEPWHRIYSRSAQDIRAILAELKAMDIGGITIVCPNPAKPDPDWPEYARRLAAAVDDAGFGVSCHAPTADISATSPETRAAAVKQVADAVELVGSCVPNVTFVVHPEDFKPQRILGDDQARMTACRQSLEQLVAVAAPSGGRIAVENMRARPDAANRTGMLTRQLTEIIKGTDARHLGICLDTGHANISEKGLVAEAFRDNADRIIHIHYDDNDGVEDSHLQPGEGTIDFAAFFAAVKAAGYANMVELEVKTPPEMSPRDFCRQNRDYLNRVSSPTNP